MNSVFRISAVAGCVLISTVIFPQIGQAQNFYRGVSETLHGAHRALFERTKPASEEDPCVEELSKEIDWLEHQIETYGSVVPKSPDVWGESRLTKHRQQYEEQIYKAFRQEKFNAGLQAAIRRSDQSFLGMAFVLNAALADGNGGGTVTAAASASSDAQGLIDAPDPTRTPLGSPPLNNFRQEEPGISLEPTIVNDQLSRYLNHLNELRRINEGDDIADSPGYSLNLVRIPVSVLPGHRTLISPLIFSRFALS